MAQSNPTIPIAHEPLVVGSAVTLTRSWWRYFASLQTSGQSVQIGNYMLHVAANGDLIVTSPSGATTVIATP